MKKLIFILLFIPLTLFADRELSVFVGDTFDFSYSLKFKNLQKLSIQIEIDNPTLLLPEQIIIKNDTTELIADSKYIFSANDINLNSNDSLLFTVSGLVLAGNDTTANANVSFIINDNFEINNEVKFTILNYAPMPYIRFPEVLSIYPNPVYDENTINVIYQLDEDSEVLFRIYSLSGKLMYEKETRLLEKGEKMQIISTEQLTDSGIYLLLIKTKNLITLEKFIFIK
jgi:hypothetical protein